MLNYEAMMEFKKRKEFTFRRTERKNKGKERKELSTAKEKGGKRQNLTRNKLYFIIQ